MARVRKKRVFVNLKDQKEFPTACTGYLWGTPLLAYTDPNKQTTL
jgi:hypothetical protein